MSLCPTSSQIIQKRSVEAIILCQMPFLTQPSPFPGLGLAPPMAPITVEAGDFQIAEKQLIYNCIR
jgi:hypothetical protein